VLLNTSFNLDDEPIVCSAADSFRTFARSTLDELYVGHYRIQRTRA
jgi:carbamoyltransferase